MAKYEKHFRGDFTQVLSQIDRAVMEGSSSASLEDSSDMYCGDARCAVRVYERYSWSGGNRVSLNLTLFGVGDELMLSAITAGGIISTHFTATLGIPLSSPALKSDSIGCSPQVKPGYFTSNLPNRLRTLYAQ